MVASDAETLAPCGGHMNWPREQLSEDVCMHWLSWQSEKRYSVTVVFECKIRIFRRRNGLLATPPPSHARKSARDGMQGLSNVPPMRGRRLWMFPFSAVENGESEKT